MAPKSNANYKIVDLRSDLINVLNNLKSRKMKGQEAKEQINAAGKIIASAKIELEYNLTMGYRKKITFLEA